MASSNNEIVTDFFPVLRIYKNGTVERIFGSPYVPPSPNDPTTGVSSKDISISSEISARIYLPPGASSKLPILVYFHSGAFCVESAFSAAHHAYLNAIVSESRAVAISVEYRSAPEHPLPAAYEDCWTAIQWVGSHSTTTPHPTISVLEPWITNFGDFNRIYIGGDSAGGNIVHNILLRAGNDQLCGNIKIKGAFLSHPYFWGSEPLKGECGEESLAHKLWMFVNPSAAGGIDDPAINPFVGPSLKGLRCSRLLVCVSEKDELRERGVKYCEVVRESGWEGEVELVQVEGEDHCFHIFGADSDNARNLTKKLASFIV
ncbi:hypothetical protein LguiA_030882 [Lonicera macranthoides]